MFPIFILLALEIPEESKRLALQIKRGDTKAFKFFYDTHHKAIYRYLMARNIREESAEDLVQQAFIWIWENRTSIDPEKSLKAYLFRIGYTRMLNMIRDNHKIVETDVYAVESGESASADAEIINAELRIKIHSVIASMPEKRRAVFEMCYLQELSYKQVAEILEMSVKTVENHMGLALKYLREQLSNER